MGKCRTNGGPTILWAGFDPAILLSAPCLTLLLLNWACSVTFTKYLCCGSSGCAHLCGCQEALLPVFHLQKNCCNLWSARITVTFPPCLASFVVLFLECQVVQEENTNDQFTVFGDLNSINYLSGGADVHWVFMYIWMASNPFFLASFLPLPGFPQRTRDLRHCQTGFKPHCTSG